MQIGLVTKQQYESLVDLLCELHAHYNDPPTASRQAVQDHLLSNLVSAGSPLRLVVIEAPEHGVVGFAALVMLDSLVEPSPDRRRQCHMKELFVRESHRGCGLGRTLMRWVAEYALDQGCGRMDWHIQTARHASIAFYEALGARRVADRQSYRLSRSDMIRLVES